MTTTDSPTEPVDLLAPEATEDPYTVLGHLREEDPVHWSERHQAWVITRFDDVEDALKDYQRLSSARVGPVLERARREGTDTSATRILEILEGWMVVSDPPAHTRLRKLAAGAFKGQQITAMTDQMRALIDGYVTDFVGSGEADLIANVAYPLPASVIALMLGAPPEDRDTFGDWADELALVAFGAGGEARSDRHQRALQGVLEMFAYLQTLLDAVRSEPGDDMMSALAEPVDDGDRLTDEELLSMCALLLFAGHETTTNSTANAVVALLEHPDQLAALRAGEVQMSRAVEELLRYDGPIKILHRHVIEDHERGGKEIRAGERVLVALASANRDPDQFDDPDTLDVTRYPNRHVAFGRGIHACVGAQLARQEMRLNLEAIIERLPGLRLADGAELAHVPSLASRALRDLPVAHDA